MRSAVPVLRMTPSDRRVDFLYEPRLRDTVFGLLGFHGLNIPLLRRLVDFDQLALEIQVLNSKPARKPLPHRFWLNRLRVGLARKHNPEKGLTQKVY
jgi:hypothetical protein